MVTAAFTIGTGIGFAADEYGQYMDRVYAPIDERLAWRGCVLRFGPGAVRTDGTFPSGGGPYIFSDRSHISVGCRSTRISSGGDLVITTDDGMVPMSSAWVVGDETLASRGIICGPSVGSLATTIRCHKSGVGRLYLNRQAHWDAISGSTSNVWAGWFSVVSRPQ